MSERQRDVALAIKRCLDSLQADALNSRMPDLARFLELAAQAAEEAAQGAARMAAEMTALTPQPTDAMDMVEASAALDLLKVRPAGHC